MRSIITLAALVAAALPLAPASAQVMRGYVSGPTRLYSGPLRDYPSVRTLRRGTLVNVQGCLRDWTWCDVIYRGDRGWIAGNALRISYQGRRRGIADNMGIGVTTFSFGTYWDNHYQGRRFYGQRQRWQSQTDNAYRPEWGEREQRRVEDHQRGTRERDGRRNPRSMAVPDRFPDHSNPTARPLRQSPGPRPRATNNNDGRTRPVHGQDQGNPAGHPHH